MMAHYLTSWTMGLRVATSAPSAPNPGLAALILIFLVACEQRAPDTSAPVSPAPGAPAIEDKPGMASPQVAARPQLKPLGPDERRVLVFVLPGDASVEVDGQLVRRRDGVIEIIGKLGEVHRLRAFKGSKSTDEKAVTIQEAGASLALVDLNEAPAPGALRTTTAAKPVRFGVFDE